MKIENYLKNIKDYWVLISVGSFALMIALLVCGYSSVFSGDIGASIEYVQAYISSMGITKIAVILVVVMLFFTVLLFIPAHASMWLSRHGQPARKIILWVGVVYAICIFAGLIFTFLSGGYSTDPRTIAYYFIYSLIWVFILTTLFIIVATPILSDFMQMFHVKEKRCRPSWDTTIFLVIAMVGSLWQPENVLLLINGGNDTGYMACVSGNRNINGKSEFFEKTVIPVSYDSRGVQVFAGDYNDKNKRWTNIRREYLYFNEGYEVKLGKACPERAEGK